MTRTSNRSGLLESVFLFDGYYNLHLRIGELEKLEEYTNKGIEQITAGIFDGSWRIKDMKHTVRLALIGGGLDHKSAHDLVESYITSGNLHDYKLTVLSVLQAALIGAAADDESIEDDGADISKKKTPETPES